MTDEKTALVSSGAQLPPAFSGQQLPRSLAELRPIIESAFESWLNKTESEKTRVAYRNDVKQFLSYHGLDPSHVEQMTRMVPDDVSGWRDHLLKFGGRKDFEGNPTPASNSTVTRKLTAVRSLFSFLQKGGYRGPNPADPQFVDAPTVPDKGVTPAIAPKQMNPLLAAPEVDSPVGIRDRAILAVFAYMALRVEELHSLRVENLVRNGDHLTIRIKGKGNTEREGVVPPLAARPLRAWIAEAEIDEDGMGPLFRPGNSPRGLGRDGFARRPMTVRALQKLTKKYCKEVGIDRAVTVHSLRVTAATTAYNAGISLHHIQHWLGHKDPRTTERYIRTGQELDKSPAYVLQFG